jgi:hypothetical protein
VLLALGSFAASAHAQEEVGGAPRGGYAWGEGERATAEPDDPMRIMAFVGAGAGFRLLRNLDSPFLQDFLTPAFLDLGVAVFLPGAEVRNGAGLTVSANLVSDRGMSGAVGPGPFAQWSFTPSYHLLFPLRRIISDMQDDLVHLQLRLGLPIVVSVERSFVDVSVGGELAFAVFAKFLAGLGMYFEAQAGIYGGSDDTIHPILTFDAGFFVDYEVLQ